MTLGKRIKEQRNRLGLSQEKIAEMVGTSRQAVTKWEADRSVPCMENLITLADIFGITISELSGGTGDSESAQHRKAPIIMDILFVLVAVIAVRSIFRIPEFIGFSVVGFLTIVFQAAAVLYIPIYLFVIRPRQMKRSKRSIGSLKERILWALGAAAALVVGYILCGHVFFFLHGMGQWPIALFIFGMAVIVVAALADCRKTMCAVACGYVIGFAAGMIFNWDTFDPNRYAYRNNDWEIWTAAYLIIIAAGVVWDVIGKWRQAR